MSKPKYATLAFGLALLAAACGRDPMTVPDDLAGQGGASGPAAGKGGGRGGAGGGGAGGTVMVRLPDGGISALLGDSGILGGIMDAPRDSILGQLICGPEAKLGAQCSGDTQPCLLPKLGGVCACLNGNYLCPMDTTAEPAACPKNAATGSPCLSPLSVCIGGGANACICLVGSYSCL